jgi:hypothetical protein
MEEIGAMRRIFLVLLALGLAGCVALDDAGQIEAETAAYGTPIALGEWVWLNKPYLRARPTKVIEDSRCPPNARCVWEGRVTLAAEGNFYPEPETIGTSAVGYKLGKIQIEFSTDTPRAIVGGDVTIAQVQPIAAHTGAKLEPSSYRFVLEYRSIVLED